jgi:hypothetical protein
MTDNQSSNPSSLQLSTPLGGVLLRAFLLLAALAILLEAGVRLPFAQDWLPRRSLGISLDHFELKWFLLEEYVQAHGGVDVIILGNSLVNTGIDPQVVADTFQEASGIPARVFNFGVEGMFVEPNAFTAQLLIEKYHPAVLVVVTEAREYGSGAGTDATQRYFASPWIQYQQGQWSPLGWLFDHSLALQRYLPYRNWVRSDFREQMRLYDKHLYNVHPNGYDPDLREQLVFDSPPDPSNPDNQDLYAMFQSYDPAPERLEALRQLFSLGQRTGTVIVVMEMPLHPSNYDYFGEGEADHAQFLAALAASAQEGRAPLLPTLPESKMPADGRADRAHLNWRGAPVLSAHLGNELAQVGAVLQALLQVAGQGGE